MSQAEERGSRGWVGWLQVGIVVLALAIGIYYARAPQLAEFDTVTAQSTEAPTVSVVRPASGSHALTLTLLLQDRYNVILRAGNVPAVAAVSGAIRQRFRPIVLTTVTTVVALAPVVYLKSETTEGALVPIVLSLAGGLVVGGIAILFIVPAIQLLAENARQRWSADPEAETAASGSRSL